MESIGKRIDEVRMWRNGRERLRLECRECEVICERVVSPWQCLRSQCSCIYVFDDGETSYFGCLHKVFAPELDLAAFSEQRARSGRGSDPYGPLRVSRTPRPQCSVTIEKAYEIPAEAATCCNPTFFHHPLGREEDRMRLTSKSSSSDLGSQG
jgi:hypothetical protein